MTIFLALFFFSGFCGLVYEVVWLRLAMGAFGVTAPYISIFLSVFMAGLGLGSWASGLLTRRLGSNPGAKALRLYAGTELLIAISSLAVPVILHFERGLLSHAFGGAAWGSFAFYAASGLCTAAALLPWCVCMGATYPLAMAAIERLEPARSRNSFSFLYLANVVGAATGAFTSAFVLIELLGFRRTLVVAAAFNLAVAAVAWILSSRSAAASAKREERALSVGTNGNALALLFLTGLVSMAMEIVWTRQFTPYLGNSVYAFAFVLGVYLLASFGGTCLYRGFAYAGSTQYDAAWIGAGVLSLLSVYTADPYLPFNGYVRVLFGLAPFCALLGYLTPHLIDGWSGGDPARAGKAYAVNVLGCIVGPLVAGFLLLPHMAERHALALLSLPLFGAGYFAALRQRTGPIAMGRIKSLPLFALTALLGGALVGYSTPYEERLAIQTGDLTDKGRIERDYQATVTGVGVRMQRGLLVNGIGMTKLTPITKAMAHLPLSFLSRPPQNALVICFGMGTTFRSLVSWGLPATAVELVPSVPKMFDFYHADARKVLAAPNARVIIDDGRRFLERTTDTFDVITVDPAPPMTAAGTSFLYSEEFYAAVKARLSPDGIMAAWFPDSLDAVSLSAFAKAIKDQFPYVRVFKSLEGWGYHCLASRKPIANYSAAQLAAHLPAPAAADFLEFGPKKTPAEQFALMLGKELSIDQLITPGGDGLRDDRPVNEYYLLRRRFAKN